MDGVETKADFRLRWRFWYRYRSDGCAATGVAI